MQVVLRRDVSSLGNIGDTVNVAAGYARNYLIPKGLALKSNPESIKAVAIEKERLKAAIEKQKDKARIIAEKLEKVSCTILVKVGENDKLFGSVTSQDIVKHLKDEGIEISKKQVHMEKHIKELGVYKVPIKLGWSIETNLKVWVVKA